MTGGPDAPDELRLLWLALPGSRPGREASWLGAMPGAHVDVVGDQPLGEGTHLLRHRYRHLSHRFVEAGALAWLRDLDAVPDAHDWVASLELCSLVTGQAQALGRRRGLRRAVLTWGNDARHLLYRLPPYRQALARTLDVDRAVCFVEAAVDHCVAVGIPEERCVHVAPPVDVDLFHPAEQRSHEPVLAFVSPLAPNKGVDRVLAALDLVRRRIPQARLVVAGDGPLRGLVSERAEAGDGAVELLGPLRRPEVAGLLRSASVLVTAPRPTPVWDEQFGLAYVEAMASGLPVVTTICGTNHEAVRPPNLRVPDRAGALAEAVLDVLEHPGRWDAVGRSNRAEVVRRHAAPQQLAALRAALDLG